MSETFDISALKAEQRKIIEKIPFFSHQICQSSSIKLVAGVDIGFFPEDDKRAVIVFAVFDYSNLKVVFELVDEIELTMPYISGFLAFREVPHLTKLLSRVPLEFKPDLILVDGQGVWHPAMCGAATHMGVLTGIPTVGVAKKIMKLSGMDLDEISSREASMDPGSYFSVSVPRSSLPDAFPHDVDNEEVVLGAAVRPLKSKVPIYVSVGVGVTLEVAVEVVIRCGVHRVVEPIRYCDLKGREIVRQLIAKEKQ